MPEANIPAVMRAARLHKPGGPLSIDQVAVPEPGPRDVLIAVKACGAIPNMNAIFSGTLWNRLPTLPASVGLAECSTAGAVNACGLRHEPHNFITSTRVAISPANRSGGHWQHTKFVGARHVPGAGEALVARCRRAIRRA